MFEEPVLIERRDGVIKATMNRPSQMNAMNSAMRAKLADFWEQLRDDSKLRVGIIRGAGSRAFSSGRDLKETASAYAAGSRGMKAELTGRMGYPTDITIGKPVIAAIDGYCLAAGLKLAFGCDIRIATPASRFGNPQVKVGRGTEMPVRLLKAGVPHAVVMDMVMTGMSIDGAAALRWGLISRLVPTERLDEEAWAIAGEISDNSPAVVGAIKRLIDRGVADRPLTEALAAWNEADGLFGDTADARAGAAAFAARERPRF